MRYNKTSYRQYFPYSEYKREKMIFSNTQSLPIDKEVHL